MDPGLGLGGSPPVSGGYPLRGVAGHSAAQLHGYLAQLYQFRIWRDNRVQSARHNLI